MTYCGYMPSSQLIESMQQTFCNERCAFTDLYGLRQKLLKLATKPEQEKCWYWETAYSLLSYRRLLHRYFVNPHVSLSVSQPVSPTRPAAGTRPSMPPRIRPRPPRPPRAHQCPTQPGSPGPSCSCRPGSSWTRSLTRWSCPDPTSWSDPTRVTPGFGRWSSWRAVRGPRIAPKMTGPSLPFWVAPMWASLRLSMPSFARRGLLLHLRNQVLFFYFMP